MVFYNWIGQAERNLPSLLPATKPLCLVALEYKKPIATVVATPFNRRGTCWSLDFPELLSEPKECSLSQIKQSLLQKALGFEKTKAQSWLIRCQANDKSLLSIARGNGFQPLKIFNCWSSKGTITSVTNSTNLKNSLFEWQKINKENANHLLRLEQVGQSSNLRQILDRQLRDLIELKQALSGVLISNESIPVSVIAGLLLRETNENKLTIELLRDLAWDERIVRGIPYILEEINKFNDNILIETSIEDQNLTELLSDIGCTFQHENILLGKTLWRRQGSRKVINGAKNLESMLGRLRPNTPPLPAPSLEPR